MARKFFNQKVNNSQKTLIQVIIIVASLIGIIICFLIASHFLNKAKDKPKATIEMRDSVAVEVNTSYPDKTLFFSELENVDEKEIDISFNNADLTKIGDYPVKIKVFDKEYDSVLQVVDTMSPTLTLKSYTINSNESYTLNDFIIDCVDNSKEACEINYFTGTDIDYGSYTTPGEYQIQIIAGDSSGNTTVQETTLTINSSNDKPIIPSDSCQYGNGEYDKDKYILALNVTENGCGRDLNLYQSDVVLEGVNKLMNQETEKLQKEFSKLNIDGQISLVRNPAAVLNLTGNGLVGYTIHLFG